MSLIFLRLQARETTSFVFTLTDKDSGITRYGFSFRTCFNVSACCLQIGVHWQNKSDHNKLGQQISVPEIIDPVFAKTSQNARFLLSENERFGLGFVKTGSINSGTGHHLLFIKPIKWIFFLLELVTSPVKTCHLHVWSETLHYTLQPISCFFSHPTVNFPAFLELFCMYDCTMYDMWRIFPKNVFFTSTRKVSREISR